MREDDEVTVLYVRDSFVGSNTAKWDRHIERIEVRD